MPTNQQRRDAAKRKLERQLVNRQERARTRKQRNLVAGVIAAVVVIAGVIWFATSRGSTDNEAADSTGSSLDATSEAAPITPCSYPAAAEAAVKEAAAPTNTNPAVTGTVNATVTLNSGVIPITLDRAKAPCAVNAFISLASQGFYNDTTCHRITTDDNLKIMQCGDPSGTGRGGAGFEYAKETAPASVDPTTDAAATDSSDAASTDGSSAASTEDSSSAETTESADSSAEAESTDATETTTTEAPPTYPVGTVAMANTGANSMNGSQFFIVYGEADLTADAYTVIGTVDSAGLAVIDAIAAKGTKVGTNPNGALDAPAETVQVVTIEVPADAADAPGPVETSSADVMPTDPMLDPALTESVAPDTAGQTGTDAAGTDAASTDEASTDTASTEVETANSEDAAGSESAAATS